jgi:ribosomal-protein-serine acetyltransferase
MPKKFKNKLTGERVVLKRTKPTITTATTIFSAIDANRKHIRPYMLWEKHTLKIEDLMQYLFDKEKLTKLGEKVEYGIYLNNEYIGNIGVININQKNKSAEIGYWLAENFTKKGYMTEAVKILEKEFFENFKLNRIQIHCDEQNEASKSVIKKCGYKFEGTHREDSFNEYFNNFRNTLMFSKLQSEYKTDKANKK